jgi:glutathione peroxidase
MQFYRWSLLPLSLLLTASAFAVSPSLYDLKVKSLAGRPVSLKTYRGKVALVVNTASQCGYTPQYKGLEALYRQYAKAGFVILGFPCNDFGGQEPGSPEQIQTFCTGTYHVTFPMFEKVSVKPGPGQAPVYSFLTASGNTPGWNFSKYLIDRDGHIVKFFPSKVTPEAPELVEAVQAQLKKGS